VGIETGAQKRILSLHLTLLIQFCDYNKITLTFIYPLLHYKKDINRYWLAGCLLLLPSMGAILWKKAMRYADHGERRVAQLHEGDRVGGCVNRACDPMDKNRIHTDADRGERGTNRKALY
jgi:hypothetical protein